MNQIINKRLTLWYGNLIYLLNLMHCNIRCLEGLCRKYEQIKCQGLYCRVQNRSFY